MERLRKAFIYYIRNMINGKGYVGQHVGVDPSKRWNGHITASMGKRNSKFPVHCAIRKYGVEAFTAEILWKGKEDQINKKEIFYVKKLHTHVSAHGYNLTYGGDGMLGFVWTEESKAKSSRSAILRLADPLVRASLSVSAKKRWEDGTLAVSHGAKQSAAWKHPVKGERLRTGMVKRSGNMVWREKIRIAITGIKQSDETVAKRVAKNTGKKRSPEQCGRITAAKIGVPWSPAMRKAKTEQIARDKEMKLLLQSGYGHPWRLQGLDERTRLQIG